MRMQELGTMLVIISFLRTANYIKCKQMTYNSEYKSEERTVGFFGQLSLSYANQLYLTVTGRNDIVSTMPRGNRSFFYPSVSLGWISQSFLL